MWILELFSKYRKRHKIIEELAETKEEEEWINKLISTLSESVTQDPEKGVLLYYVNNLRVATEKRRRLEKKLKKS